MAFEIVLQRFQRSGGSEVPAGLRNESQCGDVMVSKAELGAVIDKYTKPIANL